MLLRWNDLLITEDTVYFIAFQYRILNIIYMITGHLLTYILLYMAVFLKPWMTWKFAVFQEMDKMMYWWNCVLSQYIKLTSTFKHFWLFKYFLNVANINDKGWLIMIIYCQKKSWNIERRGFRKTAAVLIF